MKDIISKIILITILSIYSFGVNAKPDLGSYVDISVSSDSDKIRIYRDHKNKKKWYVTPAKIILNSLDGPGYSLDLMRYKGRKGSGDADKFWIKSVLHLQLKKKHDKKIMSSIRKALKQEGHKVLSIKQMPIVGSRIKVLMGDLQNDWTRYSKWSDKSIAIALNNHLSQILWDSAQKTKDEQQQLMSIEVQTLAKGVRKSEAEIGDSKKSKWNDAEIEISETISVMLDAPKYPELFRRTDLDANIDFGYTGMDVFCFDFLEGNYPDLYAVLVDIKIKTEDRDLIKQLRFDDESDYRYRIDFGIAKSLDEPYMVRLTYIDKDGVKNQGKWFRKDGELMLDVTRYK